MLTKPAAICKIILTHYSYSEQRRWCNSVSKQKREALIACCFLFLLHVPVQASPSFQGATGLTNVPTANTLSTKGFNLGFKKTLAEDAKTKKTNIFFFNYGIRQGLEIGGGSIEEVGGENQTLLQGKINISPETEGSPGVSTGILYYTEKVPDLDRATLYAVATQKLDFPPVLAKKFNMSFHIGIGNNRLDGAFGGVEMAVSPMLVFSAEYDTVDFNFGARFELAKGIIAEAARIKEDFGFGIIVNVMPK